MVMPPHRAVDRICKVIFIKLSEQSPYTSPGGCVGLVPGGRILRNLWMTEDRMFSSCGSGRSVVLLGLKKGIAVLIWFRKW